MSIFDQYQRGWQMGEGMAQQKKKSTLASLMQQAHGAPREQRQGIIGQAIGIDPDAGMAMQKQFDVNDEASMKEVVNSARLLTQAPEQMRAQLYQTQILPKLKSLGYPAPDQYGPEVDQYAQQIAQAWGPGEQTPAGVVEFNALTQGMSPEEVERARRVKLGLDPRASQPGQPVIKADDNGNLWAIDPVTLQMTPVQPGSQSQTAGPTGGASMVLDDALTNAVMMQESGGNPNAVSPKGARGLMQIMPGTARDPGFGIAPMRDDSPQENMRVGREYLSAMLQRYNGDQQLALAAYNAGPGRVDQALQAAGGNPQAALARLPAETRNYVPSVQARMGQGGQPTFGRKQPEAPKPRDTFAPLTSDEVQAMGLPAGTVAQRNLSTGQVSILNKPSPKPAADTKRREEVRSQAAAFDQIESMLNKLESTNDESGFSSIFWPFGEGREKYRVNAQQLSVLLKPLIRGSGEGTWTDKDQELLERLTPQLDNYEGTNEEIIANVRGLLESRRRALGIQTGARPGADKRPSNGVSPQAQALLDKYGD